MWQNLYEVMIKTPWEQPQLFKDGYCSGMLMALLIVILLLLLRLLWALVFRTKRCKSILIREKDGDLLISAEAVNDVIKSLQSEFHYIHMDKIQLSRRSGKYMVLLYVSFNTQGGGMPEQRAKLKQRIKDALNEVFGIKTISKVSMRCAKTEVNGSLAKVHHDEELKPLPKLTFKPEQKKDQEAQPETDSGKDKPAE
jgi:hypothetical protein